MNRTQGLVAVALLLAGCDRSAPAPAANNLAAVQPQAPAAPAQPSDPAAPGPQVGDVLDETKWDGSRTVLERGWEWAGGGLFNGQRDHVLTFRRGQSIMLVLAEPVGRSATGGILTSRVTRTYIVELAPGETQMDECAMNGEPVLLGIRNAAGDRYTAVTTDGRDFQNTGWQPLSAFDRCGEAEL